MVVQHNLQAMNANRMLNVTTNAQSKSTEKLSSGYRINRAADDAAGLSISEKMRKQIRGLDQASTNAQDGVSAVQTAEGALTEVHSMLQRMNELATQSANGTNSDTDRKAIQDEIDQLTTEIDRVAETTKFNEMYLLKGDSASKETTKTLNAHDAGLKGMLTDNGDGTSTFTRAALSSGDKISIKGIEYTIVDSSDVNDYTDINKYTKQTAGDKLTQDGVTYTYVGAKGTTPAGIQADETGGWYKDDNISAKADTVTIAQGDKLTSAGKTTTLVGDDQEATTISTLSDAQDAIKALDANQNVTIGGTEYTVAVKTDLSVVQPTATADDLAKMITSDSNIKIGDDQYYVVPKGSEKDTEITADEAYKMMAEELKTASSIGADTAATVTNNGDGTFDIKQGTVSVPKSLSFSLHVGSDADMTNKISVNIDSMSSAGLGIKGIKVDSESSATYAVDAIADAISTVSSQRSALGAVQNRLEHTINNLDNVVENTTSAESRIRDTDMAEEMVTYSKNNILAQAGQSMLAQANSSNQGVLTLLQ